MQSEQIIKPHGHVQQKVSSCEQALHIYFSGLRHLPFRPDFPKPLIFPSFSIALESIRKHRIGDQQFPIRIF
jgi:hypothetical protein